MTNLVKDKELYAYKHNGFWSPMDTPEIKLGLIKCVKMVKPLINWDK